MKSPLSLAIEGMVATLNEVLQHYRVEVSIHTGRRISALEVHSIRQSDDKSVEITADGYGKLAVRNICRLEDWPEDDHSLRAFALQARTQPSIACFYVLKPTGEAPPWLVPDEPCIVATTVES